PGLALCLGERRSGQSVVGGRRPQSARGIGVNLVNQRRGVNALRCDLSSRCLGSRLADQVEKWKSASLSLAADETAYLTNAIAFAKRPVTRSVALIQTVS